MRCSILFSTLLIILATASVVLATTIHVPGDQPTIQAGIDVANVGDTVLVADGVYTGTGNRDIHFWGKAILVISENGPESTVIDCEGSARAFSFDNGEDTLAVLQGFTVRNGYSATEGGGGIICTNSSSPSIIGNVFLNCYASTYGGAIVIYENGPSCVIILNNTFDENSAGWEGAGLSVVWGGGCALFKNNILSNSPDGDAINSSEESNIFNSYNDFWNNIDGNYGIHVDPGVGEIYQDPLYTGGIPFDYHLSEGSPCIDAGDPESPPDPDGSRSDLGAFFFDQRKGTIRVPQDYPTIQAGIDEAFLGDTVLVADGLYTGPGNKSLDFNGKRIVLRSENGSENTTIDCENDGMAFHLHSGEDSLSVIEGFTVMNGNSSDAGGIFLENVSPKIRYCDIVGNTGGFGGGINLISHSAPIILGCRFDDNTAKKEVM